MKIKVVEELDVPSKRTGRIFTTSLVKKLIKEYYKSRQPMYGELVPSVDSRSDWKPFHLHNLSHKIGGMWIENGAWYAEIEIQKTTSGAILKELIDNVYFGPRLIATLEEDGKTLSEDAVLLNIDAFPEMGIPSEQQNSNSDFFLR